MNKNVIKEFAVSARNKLRADIITKLHLIGITEKEIKQPLEQSDNTTQFFNVGAFTPYSISGKEIEQRNNLINQLRSYEAESDYKTAYDRIIEEVAYTWFNRLIALRFMEVNDYLPSQIRVLSSYDRSNEPEILRYPFNADIDYTDQEIDYIESLQDENNLDELFKFLFIKQCNELNESLPFLFESTEDYTELLFPFDYRNNEGVIKKLISLIDEDDFNINNNGQVEIIGWLYQFYNSELKDEVFKRLNKNEKISKDTLPAATQLFTPHWIVKYLVENSLGRLWIEHLLEKDKNLKERDLIEEFGWKYYVLESRYNTEFNNYQQNENIINLEVENIKILDPSMGSGHILSYSFDILMQIYISEGYSQRDAALKIIKNNLYGLDIDKRATQLAYFSLLMKARNYNRRILNYNNLLNLYSFRESTQTLENFVNNIENEEIKKDLNDILQLFKESLLLGSLLKLNRKFNYDKLENYLENLLKTNRLLETNYIILKEFIKILKILDSKFDIVVANPPYLGNKRFNHIIKEYLYKEYPIAKLDLYLAFIEKNLDWVKKTGYLGMITMNSWMFLSSSEKLRKYLLDNSIINMAHLGTRAFEEIGGEVVQTTAFILSKEIMPNSCGKFYRLVNDNNKEELFLDRQNEFIVNQDRFLNVPGSPIAYWVSDVLFASFENGTPLGQIADSKQGLATADNNRFLRLWTEVDINNIKFNAHNLEEASDSKLKWFPYNKGGDFRKWYGNNDYIVNWENDGFEIKNIKDKNGKLRSRPQNTNFYFKESITWSTVSSALPAFRYKPFGFVFDSKGSSIFTNNNFYYLLALNNSKVTEEILKILCPTIDFANGKIAQIPVILDDDYRTRIETLAQENIEFSKQDWDAFEFSWDFKKHPLVRDTNTVEEAFNEWEQEAQERFDRLKANEEELNKIFIDVYNMQEELSPEVEDKYVSVRKADLEREIKSLISYAVGCMFGRYSLDKEGIAYAGGEWNPDNYQTFIPDVDNVIPIIDNEYFEDDIVGLFIKWLEKVYGKETLETNLDFIANALGKKGNKTSREVIREYFLKDFIKDHNKIYQKRPIYWLYSSGKNNGFKALVYMHRYNEDTSGRVATYYLDNMIKTYQNEIARMDFIMDTSQNKRDGAKARKNRDKLLRQLKESQEYDDRLSHIANLRIPIDLDDGVKVNYDKVQTDETGTNLKILIPIN